MTDTAPSSTSAQAPSVGGTDPSSWNHRASAIQVASYFSERVKDRVILITGPSIDGVGFATALALAKQEPKLLILAGRTVSKLEQIRDELESQVPGTKTRLLQVDLSDMTSVRAAGEKEAKEEDGLDIIINNAAVMDTPYSLTKDGYEHQLASNYLGHWLLTNLLLPKLLDGKDKRVVNVSSIGHQYGGINWEDPHFKNGEYNRNKAYGQSKTAMNLHSIELTRRYDDQGLTSFSLHPGGISTGLQQHWTEEYKQSMNKNLGFTVFKDDGTPNYTADGPWKTPDNGASTSIRAALDPDIANESGAYLDDCQIAQGKAAEYAKDPEAARRLWNWTNDILGTNY